MLSHGSLGHPPLWGNCRLPTCFRCFRGPISVVWCWHHSGAFLPGAVAYVLHYMGQGRDVTGETLVSLDVALFPCLLLTGYFFLFQNGIIFKGIVLHNLTLHFSESKRKHRAEAWVPSMVTEVCEGTQPSTEFSLFLLSPFLGLREWHRGSILSCSNMLPYRRLSLSQSRWK